jgi:N-acetylneuraminic acid mutarotase
MILMGNPANYILIFGGATEQYIPNSESPVNNIKQTLNDMWLYSTKTRIWQQMFLNSGSPPARELSQMTSIREDRLLVIFGGLDGQNLYDDVW